jgi:hypothetical protein
MAAAWRRHGGGGSSARVAPPLHTPRINVRRASGSTTPSCSSTQVRTPSSRCRSFSAPGGMVGSTTSSCTMHAPWQGSQTPKAPQVAYAGCCAPALLSCCLQLNGAGSQAFSASARPHSCTSGHWPGHTVCSPELHVVCRPFRQGPLSSRVAGRLPTGRQGRPGAGKRWPVGSSSSSRPSGSGGSHAARQQGPTLGPL